MGSSSGWDAAGIVRREWWVVAVAVAVAAAVALLAGGTAADVYVGRAQLAVDTNPNSRYRGVPTPDELQRAVGTAEVRSRLASAAGMDESDVAAGLSVSTGGNPQNTFAVEFRSGDEAEAEEAAGKLAAGIREFVLDSASEEIERRREEIDYSHETADELERIGPSLRDPWQRADNLYKVWVMRSQALMAENSLEALEAVYTLDPDVTVRRISGSTTSRRDLVGAALVGLVLGAAVAAGRELWLRRRAVND